VDFPGKKRRIFLKKKKIAPPFFFGQLRYFPLGGKRGTSLIWFLFTIN
jgi:hypothetical protein